MILCNLEHKMSLAGIAKCYQMS